MGITGLGPAGQQPPGGDGGKCPHLRDGLPGADRALRGMDSC
jgi:hypothetical protein